MATLLKTSRSQVDRLLSATGDITLVRVFLIKPCSVIRCSERALWFRLLVVAWRSDAQEDECSTIQPHHVLVSQAAETRPDL